VAAGYNPPRLERRALLQTHCHQHAVVGTEADEKITTAMGLDVARPDSGCCGMAGSFGYETGERYHVSMAAGERVILPQVRAAADSTIVLADGFSCRAQIDQGSGRQALHLAQVLALARRYGRDGPPGRYPEEADPAPVARASMLHLVGMGMGAGFTAIAGVFAARAIGVHPFRHRHGGAGTRTIRAASARRLR
jgi:hypothetical protein